MLVLIKKKNKNENKIQVKEVLTHLQKILNEIKKNYETHALLSHLKFK